MTDDEAATPLEKRAYRIVKAITAKGPKLTLAVAEQLRHNVKLILSPWTLIPPTNGRQHSIVRFNTETLNKTIATVKPVRDQWKWSVVGSLPSKGTTPSVWDAMEQADTYLRSRGRVLIEGYPTAGPWQPDPLETQANTNEFNRIVRCNSKGPALTHLARVWTHGNTFRWSLTHLAGPGSHINGDAPTIEIAQEKADQALIYTGWLLTALKP